MAEIDLEHIVRESDGIQRGIRDVVAETIKKLIPDAQFDEREMLRTIREKLAQHHELRGWVDVSDKYVKVKEK